MKVWFVPPIAIPILIAVSLVGVCLAPTLPLRTADG